MMQVHFADEYLDNDRHPITVNVIGVGGNGSQVLYNLAKINLALLELNKPGLKVYAYDDDKVEEHNLLRQSFSYMDIGEYKSSVIINRINRFYGFNWEAIPEKFTNKSLQANIYIGCTDTINSRKTIEKSFKKINNNVTKKQLYYLDIGNLKYHSQFILGSNKIKQPASKDLVTIDKLNTFMEEFGELLPLQDNNFNSCSAYQSLKSQGLFTNNMVSVHAIDLLWKLFFDKIIIYRGAHINSESCKMLPIKLKDYDRVNVVK